MNIKDFLNTYPYNRVYIPSDISNLKNKILLSGAITTYTVGGQIKQHAMTS